jgi:class 3 adenylate cyclase
MSQETLQMSNIAKGQLQQPPPKSTHEMKTAQIIESLVWFSFHIPRTVLEDLIAHELELWERTRGKRRQQQKRRGGRRTNAKEDESACSVIMGDDEDSEFLLGSVMSAEKYNGIPGKFRKDMMHLPKNVSRESAILFVDMSGFTKLATMLDVESLSKVINTYFDMILSELIQFGADILKFAGDAIFCEWRVVDDLSEHDGDSTTNILSDMNASMLMGDLWEQDEISPLASRVMQAAKCASSLVRKFSDYQVTTGRDTTDAMLNLHCGLGAGHLVGLHVGDYQEGQDVEENFELRREFLVMGSPIDQVSKAADVAKHGEVYASPEALKILECCCDFTEEQTVSTEPVCIAAREKSYLKFKLNHAPQFSSGLQPYESLRMHCKSLNHAALGRLHAQMALYVHPVIRSDELVLSAAIQEGAISQPTETIESRHRAQAELRSVYTMFISPIIKPTVTGRKEIDEKLYNTLHNIMRVTSRELDRYSGHL